jgi:uncharacterized protein
MPRRKLGIGRRLLPDHTGGFRAGEVRFVNFEWDETKNAINRSKHDVDFRDAVKVFEDECRLEREDTRADYGETRIQVLGGTVFGMLFVVYTEREGDTVRLISARAATKAEKKMYNQRSFQ